MWTPVCIESIDIFSIPGQSQSCLSLVMFTVYCSLATFDLLVAIVAGVQLLRHYLHNKRAVWTRQKVFHCLIGAANLGYVLYFTLTTVAACLGWTCFSTACGFILIAVPETLFLATFLLLLSFWVDLCNQANDNEEDDDEDMDCGYTRLPLSPDSLESGACNSFRACLPCRRWHVRGRQRCVLIVVSIIFLLAVAFAALIWFGMYDNPLDSVKLAQVYVNFFTLVVLLSGGGLAGYGLLLYTKMSRVRSGRASADISKVAGLAVASVVCFSLKASVVVMSDIIGLNIWHVKRGNSQFSASMIFCYYVIGETVPSLVVLWVMRDLPPRSCDNSMNGRATTREVLIEDALVPDPNYLSQFVSSATSQRFFLPNCCNSDVSPT
ncbi:tobamovirus multiplication protein 1 isoform X1 [Physcomitrium patens]|uniref:THH1/TOM1/TOM3 domain-containing protein n=1 Tax=Physcomitrium patens TaxID=3218 RepID=A0A2K1KKN7_PHYPA|nr:tobamovirus multiplication protein 1-like isoform X1 [Physcomitrium patens]XP_024376544.1 tobamovirus multiplication protein 1-like isoform X1 [Physcomitrium patens]XP_024376545.1 tobamovirus multiplication protein 1-like isoform X1 [Physcomitrium patens]XP_024376546.1 tobamovirus multiplication protein 1-like isoform X1 [Physcomitrium patens]XP_024376547.1 tobamovirus multiplication protein 1-like isoform X1 [Physcomitrium patens]XP_024376549.1 tobamovirus multiplication protein 1-like iso|eukprot:XP_024376543.1 tobamovirus multiplication protein 1-like isoform X1 [Physcomitrella patens]